MREPPTHPITSEAASPQKAEKYIIDILILTLLILIPYRQVAGHKFIEFDDGAYLYENPHIISGLTWDNITWAFSSIKNNVGNWHPITWISILIDRELFGPYPGGYLLMNVAWHMLATCLCYSTFRLVFSSRFAGLAIATFFAVHPVNVENVAWFSERKSLIDAVFWFLGIASYWKWRESKQKWAYITIIGTHILGLMAKPMHVVFPCALLLIHIWFEISHLELRRWGFIDIIRVLGKSIKWIWPLLIISAAASILTIHAQTSALYTSESFPWNLRIANALTSYGRYLQMFYIPREYAPFYPLFVSEITWGSAWPSITALATISAIAIYAARRSPLILLGWLWFLGTMIPVIGLVHVGSQSHADRYLYIPMIGLCFIWPAIEKALTSRIRNPILIGYLSGAAVSMVTITHKQVSYWANGSTLFRHSIQVTGDCMMSATILINSYLREGNFDDAAICAREKIARSVNPENKARLQFLLAKALSGSGQANEALAIVSEAINNGLRDQAAYLLQCDILLRNGDTKAARISLQKAKEQGPNALAGEISIKNHSDWMVYLEHEIALCETATQPKQ